MKRVLSIAAALLLLAGMLCVLPVAAAGSLTASASASTVTVGQTVTVTLTYDGGGAKIGAIDAQVTHNAETFEYVSCSGGTASGGAGVVNISWYATDATAPTSATITLTFKAKAAGAGDFAVSTLEFTDDETYSSLGTPGKTLSIAANNPTLSGNADLSSLTPSKGTLTPKFDPDTTKYTIDVNYSVTSLTLSATAADKDAKTVVSGKNSLDVGKNTRTVTVTAPNGTTKTYTVIINRAAQKTTTQGSGSSTNTTTTTTAPQPDALEVTVDGVLMTVSESQPDTTLPTGFQWTYVNINGVDVSAAKNEITNLTLVYLISEVDNSANFYIYNADGGSFILFRPLAVTGGSYVLLDMPAGQTAPTGTVAGSFAADSGTVSAFVYEDSSLKDFTVLYAISPTGATGLYVHDASDGSLQRYHETVVTEQPEGTPAGTQPEEDEEKKAGSFASFVTDNRQVILTVTVACCGVAVLLAAIVLAIKLLGNKDDSRH